MAKKIVIIKSKSKDDLELFYAVLKEVARDMKVSVNNG